MRTEKEKKLINIKRYMKIKILKMSADITGLKYINYN